MSERYLVAVSGGVDSVCLLDMLSKADHHLIVAHVEHGMRGEESVADARFVEELAKRYHLPFVSTQLHLPKDAGEVEARDRRYDFLFEKAKKHRATVVTAHHHDDIVETIAINLERGTGWRGLAVLARKGIHRPLLAFTKQDLYDYAIAHQLEWVEDMTNRSDRYTRNRLRHRIYSGLTKAVRVELGERRARQIQLRRDIEWECARLLERFSGSRYAYGMVDERVAMELLAMECGRAGAVSPTRPQARRALLAIKTAKPGAVQDVGSGVKLHFTSRHFSIEVV